MFCPECKTMLISSKGLLKCKKCGYIQKNNVGDKADPDKTVPFFCFCHKYKCPHKNYSLCPKDCGKLGPTNRCKVKCEFARQHPEECEQIIYDLQVKAGEKPTHIVWFER